ncbi:MAG: 50S ribosomal protein L24 [Candidatus Omnitrophica bacterium]|nr:50S ribosomal protein L24 [Candidatus Omnitrophota bacterium]
MLTSKTRLRKGDTVITLAGKDKGKTGKILKIFPQEGRAVVEGVNFVKKHMRKTRQDQQGGIIERENPITISNIALFCKSCNRPTRIGATLLSDGSKSRFCKKCKEMI